MSPKPAYYSVVQFVPDPSRAEGANLGVVLFCPSERFIAAKLSASNDRARKFFGRRGFDNDALNAAKVALETRLRVERDRFTTPDDLRAFAETRANALRLTPPRPMKVFSPPTDLRKLFDELVGPDTTVPRPRADIPELRTTFTRLYKEGRARRNVTVEIPVLGRPLKVPFAYKNGKLNLVKPQRFSDDPDRALRKAEQLAVEGDLLNRHWDLDRFEAEPKLIVVSQFDRPMPELSARIEALLESYPVENITQEELPSFLDRVEAEAHG